MDNRKIVKHRTFKKLYNPFSNNSSNPQTLFSYTIKEDKTNNNLYCYFANGTLKLPYNYSDKTISKYLMQYNKTKEKYFIIVNNETYYMY